METLKRIGPALGVILSMFVVAYEVRQNTNATKGATLQAISEQSIASVHIAIEHRELRVAWQRSARGLQYMTVEDADLLRWWYTGLLRITENRYLQVQLGTIDQQALEQVGGASAAYRHPYFAQYWSRQSNNFSSDFGAFVEETYLPFVQDSLPLIGGPLPEVAATWDSIDGIGR